MELKHLENELTDYYKKHSSEFVQITTMGYIKSNYPRYSFKKLHLAILKSHPHSWGFPDVSAIETAAERFEISDKISLKNKKEIVEYSSAPKEDPLTEEELEENEKMGFGDGKSMMDSIVKKSVESKIEKNIVKGCLLCEFKPTHNGERFINHEKCKDCGPHKLNFKQEKTK